MYLKSLRVAQPSQSRGQPRAGKEGYIFLAHLRVFTWNTATSAFDKQLPWHAIKSCRVALNTGQQEPEPLLEKCLQTERAI